MEDEEGGFIAIKAEQDGEVEVALDRAAPLPVLAMGSATTVQLKADELTYFKVSKLPDPNQFTIKVKSDVPTDIGFQKYRSAGRQGQKENSLWAAADKEQAPYVDNETIVLRAKADTTAVVELVPTQLLVRKAGTLKPDGVWQEATLQSITGVDTWQVDTLGKKSIYVEIEELQNKKMPDLAMRSWLQDQENQMSELISFGSFARELLDSEDQPMTRFVYAMSNEFVTVNYAWTRPLQKLPSYRIRARKK